MVNIAIPNYFLRSRYRATTASQARKVDYPHCDTQKLMVLDGSVENDALVRSLSLEPRADCISRDAEDSRYASDAAFLATGTKDFLSPDF